MAREWLVSFSFCYNDIHLKHTFFINLLDAAFPLFTPRDVPEEEKVAPLISYMLSWETSCVLPIFYPNIKSLCTPLKITFLPKIFHTCSLTNFPIPCISFDVCFSHHSLNIIHFYNMDSRGFQVQRRKTTILFLTLTKERYPSIYS